MRLAEALRIGAGRSVALTGAGGKSSVISRLVEELSPQRDVVVSTTTRLGESQSNLAAGHKIVRHGLDPADFVEELHRHRSLLLTGPMEEGTRKWIGLEPEVLGRIWDALLSNDVPRDGGADRRPPVLLIEADGARGRSWKAPASHEPPVPPWVDLVVPIVGLDVVGETVSSDLVHRSVQIQTQFGLLPDARVSPQDIARLLVDAEGGRKGVPPRAEVRALLNKADSAERLEAGRTIAKACLDESGLRAVVIGSAEGAGAHECWGRVAGVVLAAGGSSRLGSPKTLVSWRGRPLVLHAVAAALEAGLEPVVVVTGSNADEVSAVLPTKDVEIVYNPRWSAGQSTSVIAGLEAVEGRSEAACFLLADMPRVPARLIEQSIAAHRRTLSPIVAPWAGGRWANPALFDRAVFGALHSLQGDRGGRALFESYPVLPIDWDESVLLDIDTPEDLARLEAGE